MLFFWYPQRPLKTLYQLLFSLKKEQASIQIFRTNQSLQQPEFSILFPAFLPLSSHSLPVLFPFYRKNHIRLTQYKYKTTLNKVVFFLFWKCFRYVLYMFFRKTGREWDDKGMGIGMKPEWNVLNKWCWNVEPNFAVFFPGEEKIDLKEEKKREVKKNRAEFKCLLFDCKNKLLFSNIQKYKHFFLYEFRFFL